MYFDLLVVNPLQLGIINHISVSASAMCLQGEGRKDDKHATNVGMVSTCNNFLSRYVLIMLHSF